ncbi:10128_t:CDS:1, partial [Paraglomus occultum]
MYSKNKTKKRVSSTPPYNADPNQIVKNGEDFIYYCGLSDFCHIGNAFYFIVYHFQQSLHYISGCENGCHTVQYVKNNEEELSYITMCNIHPNQKDFYMYSDNNGIFSCIPSQVSYFVYHFSKYNFYKIDNYYHDDGNSNSSYHREQKLPSHTIDDAGSSIEPIENCEINTTVLSNNAATHTSASNKGKLDIIDGVIRAVYNDCIVALGLPSEDDIIDMITEWRKHGKGKNSVNSFIVYRTLLSKQIHDKRKNFKRGDFQCYVSEFASRTWKGKSASAEKAIKDLAAAINK